ncbi:ATP-binding protein [Chamaesiphon sp. VAR_48_metabat_135_sub]|uniref:ATP-binding protein n=1 Tax=Chamaesiphon sp. VAR_48_metabat_135_sub TaxID=2964699 RepID=UPI00286D1E05|nr:ATP-binding protein [Chamaesiphon sp. VAR_48_metabat_135_sub]
MTGKPSQPPNRKSGSRHQPMAASPVVTAPPAPELPRNVPEPHRSQLQGVELFAEISFKIRQSLQLKEILRTIVTEVQQVLQADRVLIYQVLPDGTGTPISEAVLPAYTAILGMEFPEEVFPLEYQQLYAKGRVRAVADVRDPSAEVADCLLEFVEQFGVKAKLIVPILHSLNVHPPQKLPPQTAIWGLLIAHQCDRPRKWAEFELELMQQLADQISIALAQGELWGQLEAVVAERTAELQAVNSSLQQEIIDRKQVEIALRQSEEQLRLITNALPVLIAYVDDRECYQFNNPAYTNWLGKSLQNIHGSPMREVWGEDCYRRMQPHINHALAGNIVTYENEIGLHDGTTRSVSINYIPHIDKDDRIIGFFALTSDISDRKAIERMKDEFISVVSHELRTPLTSLHSALKILVTGRLGVLTKDGQQFLEIADENTERLVRLVNSVLDLQRIESGAVTMEKQACTATELMIQAVEAMQAMAQQHEITLVNQPLDIQLWVDADYIVQALTNLISNAIKFSSPGGNVWLTVKRQEQPSIPPQKGRKSTRSKAAKVAALGAVPIEILFQVRDEGQGIPDHKLETIFERFQQVDSSDSRKKGGTGLGLTICRKIIEQHGGKIWVASTIGVGSTFSFTLPVIDN